MNNLDYYAFLKIKFMVEQRKEFSIKINGTSMEPNLYKNDSVNVIFDQENYKFGDLVLIEWSNRFVVHRLINVKKMITKGDNLEYNDPINLKIVGKIKENKNCLIMIGAFFSKLEGRTKLKKFKKLYSKIKRFFFDFNSKKRG